MSDHLKDMPDTTSAADASHTAELDDEYDDAAGYYTPGDPIVDTNTRTIHSVPRPERLDADGDCAAWGGACGKPPAV